MGPRHLAIAAAFACCLPLISSCATLQSMLGGQQPELNFRELKLTGWALDKVDLELVYELHNPYNVPLTLKEVAYRLDVEGRPFVSGMPKEGLRIQAKKKQVLRFPATLHFLDAIPTVAALFSKDELSYRASGSLGVDTPLGVIALPLSHSGGVQVPKLPKVEITGLTAPKLTASGAQLALGLRIDNPNDFPVKLDGLDWNFLVERASLAKGSAKTATLRKSGSQQLNIPIQVSYLGASQAAQRLIAGQKSQVSLQGALKAGKIQAPVDVSKLMELAKR